MLPAMPSIHYRVHSRIGRSQAGDDRDADRDVTADALVRAAGIDVEAVLRLRTRVEMGARSAADVAAQLAGARWVVTAHDGDRLVGLARALSDDATNGYISTVMVDPDYQRKGIGREIIRRIVEGRDHVRWVLHARKEAMAFYRALGFEDAPDMMWRDRR